jgi:hypothetical protein
LRPGINHAEPVAIVLEAGISPYDQEGKSVDAEIVVPPEVPAEAVVGNTVAVIAAALLPVAVIGIPALGAMLLPGGLLNVLLFRRAFGTLIVVLLSLPGLTVLGLTLSLGMLLLLLP